jgi:hypothetical protein
MNAASRVAGDAERASAEPTPATDPEPTALSSKPKAWARLIGPPVLLAVSLVVTLAISELFFTLLLAHPSLLRGLPQATVGHVRRLYLAHDRNLIQAMPCCARYDPDLFYTLRPGQFRFRNREFDTAFRVNHLGLRDSESDLRSPQVVVLGDSYAMGWGVDQEATLARLVARSTGLRALNAGIAGYGTVREMRLLDRIDTSALRYLVIQYCDDDVLETRPFTSHGNVFEVSDESRYGEDVKRAERRKRYWFGRRTYEFLRDVFAPEREPGPRPATPAEHARYFANTVLHAGHTDLSKVRLIAFEISQSRSVDGSFALALRKEVATDGYPRFVGNMTVLNLEGRLEPQHYYDLDDHLTQEGQAAVAAAVIEAIRQDEAPR